MLGGIIGGALGAAGNAVGMGLQAWQNKKNQEREDKIRQQTWDREDDAVQRRAKDMQLAGINPLLAAGDPAQASTGGGVTGGQAPDASGLGGAMQQTGQWIDQMAIQKKQQVLQEQKQDAEIAKIESETRGQEIENAQGDARGENLEADIAKKREETRKIEQEIAKVEAEIENIKANTALTKEKRLSEIQQRLIDSFIEVARIKGHAGLGNWLGASGEKIVRESIHDIAQDYADGKISAQQAQERMQKAQEEAEQKAREAAERNKNSRSAEEEELERGRYDRSVYGLS